jgi:UV DNA damage endonuclease
MILSHNIVPSLCCIHNGLKDQGVKFNTMTYAQYKKLGKETAMKVLADRSLNNIKTIHVIVKECAKNKWNYRIGSNVFPLMTHPEVMYKLDDFYNAAEIYNEFKLCADTIKQNKVRCSMHPDQFVVPASPKNGVAENSIRDLEQHAMIMDLLQLPQSYAAPINIHMNCYNDAKFNEVIDRLEKVIKRMSKSVTSRLVFENEDKLKSWTVYNLHEYLYKRTGIPITHDNLHHKCNSGNLTEQEAFDLSVSTWPDNIVPLFHFSESLAGKNPRAHADFPTFVPMVYSTYTKDLHLDFEFKHKESAINKISRQNLLTFDK